MQEFKRKINLSDVINIHSSLEEKAQDLRLKIINSLVDSAKPINLSYLSQETLTAKKLADRGVIVIKDNKIVYAYPISSQLTPHFVQLDDVRKFYSMCGIDSLGSTFCFNENLKINSVCSYNQEPVNIRIENYKIKKLEPLNIWVIHMNLILGENWSAST